MVPQSFVMLNDFRAELRYRRKGRGWQVMPAIQYAIWIVLRYVIPYNGAYGID